jgi:hypothetical protein
MTGKELRCLGVALDELIEHGMIDSVKKVIKLMAESEKVKDENKEQKD